MLSQIRQVAITTMVTAKPTATKRLSAMEELLKTQRLQRRLTITTAGRKTVRAARPLIQIKEVHIRHRKRTRLVTAVGIRRLVATVIQIQRQLLMPSARRKRQMIPASTLQAREELVA